MRRLPAVLAVASAAAALVAGCSSDPAPPAGSSAVESTTVTAPESGSTTTVSPSSVPSKRPSEPLPDASAILKDSSATTAELGSAHVALDVIGSMQDPSVEALDADVTQQPEPAAKGYAKIAYRGAREYVRFVIFGGDFYVSQEGGGWVDYGPASNFSGVATILSPETGLARLLTDFVDPEVGGRETISTAAGDVHAVRIGGEVSADVAKRIVPQLRATKRIACTVWIQETGDHQLVALQLGAGDGAVELSFSNWDAPVRVDDPGA